MVGMLSLERKRHAPRFKVTSLLTKKMIVLFNTTKGKKISFNQFLDHVRNVYPNLDSTR